MQRSVRRAFRTKRPIKPYFSSAPRAAGGGAAGQSVGTRNRPSQKRKKRKRRSVGRGRRPYFQLRTPFQLRRASRSTSTALRGAVARRGAGRSVGTRNRPSQKRKNRKKGSVGRGRSPYFFNFAPPFTAQF
eukprot:scaffold43119_cov33-Phaeocystis_antarctica.AAC.1